MRAPDTVNETEREEGEMRRAQLHLGLLILAILAGISACVHVPSAGTTIAPPATYKDPDALLSLLSKQNQPYVLVDVRTSAEYSGGHIPTAVNIPYDVIGAKPPTPDKAELIIVYCASGGRSSQAASALIKLGYTGVVDFGSVSRWKWTFINSNEPGACPCGESIH
jgi:rhodanese-related sulfurtransferase